MFLRNGSGKGYRWRQAIFWIGIYVRVIFVSTRDCSFYQKVDREVTEKNFGIFRNNSVLGSDHLPEQSRNGNEWHKNILNRASVQLNGKISVCFDFLYVEKKNFPVLDFGVNRNVKHFLIPVFLSCSVFSLMFHFLNWSFVVVE